MFKFAPIVFLLIFLVGCTVKTKTDFTPLIAIELGIQSMAATDNEEVHKVPRSECTHCHGKGKIRTGDRIAWEECPYCVPDKNDDSEGGNFTTKPEDAVTGKQVDEKAAELIAAVEPIAEMSPQQMFAANKLKWHTLNGKCCPECNCDPCYCPYRGACKVREQMGQHAVVWHGNQGYIYYAPKNGQLATYDKIWRAAPESAAAPKQKATSYYVPRYQGGCSSCSRGGCR